MTCAPLEFCNKNRSYYYYYYCVVINLFLLKKNTYTSLIRSKYYYDVVVPNATSCTIVQKFTFPFWYRFIAHLHAVCFLFIMKPRGSTFDTIRNTLLHGEPIFFFSVGGTPFVFSSSSGVMLLYKSSCRHHNHFSRP